MNELPPEPAAKTTKRAAKRPQKTSKAKEVSENPMQDESSSTAPVGIAEPAVKRAKRRRGKKSKGGAEPRKSEFTSEVRTVDAQEEDEMLALEEPVEEANPQARNYQSESQHSNHPQPQNRRAPYDPESLAAKAWKIFLAEVSEEGIALINDHDARELSKRCFRLAQIFLDEQSRHS